MKERWEMIGDELVEVGKVSNIWKENGYIKFRERGHIFYVTPKDCDKRFRILKEQLTKRRTPMDTTIKGYFKKHEETCITLAIIILVDHFIFNGSFRQKIQNLVDGLLAKTSKKLLEEEANENPK